MKRALSGRCGRPMVSALPEYADPRWPGGCSRRGRRCPAWAHTWAVCGTPRLPCAARPRGASQNSLRSLRSLRSNNRDENVFDARCARHPVVCAARRPRDRPRRAPSAAKKGDWYSPPRPEAPLGARLQMRPGVWYSLRIRKAFLQRRAGTGRSAPLVRCGLSPRAFAATNFASQAYQWLPCLGLQQSTTEPARVNHRGSRAARWNN